jgi:hypothetical protein
MATLTLNLRDELLDRINATAKECGKTAEQVILAALEQVFPTAEPVPDRTVGEEIEAILALIWAEQDAHPERFQPNETAESYGDAVEAYLAQHWAEDIRKRNMNR